MRYEMLQVCFQLVEIINGGGGIMSPCISLA